MTFEEKMKLAVAMTHYRFDYTKHLNSSAYQVNPGQPEKADGYSKCVRSMFALIESLEAGDTRTDA